MRKIRKIPRKGSISKESDDYYRIKGPDPKTYTFCKSDFFSKKIRPISRRGSRFKGFDDHYHVKGPDKKTYTFCKYEFFLKKIRPNPEEKVYIQRIQRPLPCTGPGSKKKKLFANMISFWKRLYQSRGEGLHPNDSATITM